MCNNTGSQIKIKQNKYFRVWANWIGLLCWIQEFGGSSPSTRTLIN